MIEVEGIIWKLASEGYEAVVAPTNGLVDAGGCNVLEVGVAMEAITFMKGLPKILGEYILKHHNNVHMLGQLALLTANPEERPFLVSFPIKPNGAILPDWDNDTINACVVDAKKNFYTKGKPGWRRTIPGYDLRAMPILIERSARQLHRLANRQKWEKILMPRPGARDLDWDTKIKPLLSCLDDRFHVTTHRDHQMVALSTEDGALVLQAQEIETVLKARKEGVPHLKEQGHDQP